MRDHVAGRHPGTDRMLKGVTLQLYVGPLVPIPAPKAVMDALDRACRSPSTTSASSGFQLSFTVSNQSPLHTLFLLTGGTSDQHSARRHRRDRQWHAARDHGRRGDQSRDRAREATPGNRRLSITGEDLTVLMDKIDFSGFPFPATPAEGTGGADAA